MEQQQQLNDVAPCSSLAVDSILRIGTAGAIWGLCTGPHETRKLGLTGITQVSYVAKAASKCSFQCGLAAGVFSITHCGIERYRRKKDWVNALIAGGVAGAAVAAGTRSWTQVIWMAALVSIFSTAADYSKAD
ncbi:Tim17 domain-containing protein [Cephalotus follicularis]|uniref:Tim17 domain-containing protein n=1 Tax=Cephalotus follicularis TaxID=3775 RepID=A0A1Q3BGF5_CEPFO|nr:Tim17 domain-containing protein [Cephalotus follicularis]